MRRYVPTPPPGLRRARAETYVRRLPLVGEEPEGALGQTRVLDDHVLTMKLAAGETGFVRRSSLIFASGDFSMKTRRIAAKSLPLIGIFSGQNLWANCFEAETETTLIAGRDFHGTVVGLDVSEDRPVWLQPALYLGHRGDLRFITRRVAKREFWTLTEVSGSGTVWIKAPGRTFRQKLDPETPVITDTNYVAAVRGAFSADGKVFTRGQYLRSGEAENVKLRGAGDVLMQTEVPISVAGSGGILGAILDIFV